MYIFFGPTISYLLFLSVFRFLISWPFLFQCHHHTSKHEMGEMSSESTVYVTHSSKFKFAENLFSNNEKWIKPNNTYGKSQKRQVYLHHKDNKDVYMPYFVWTLSVQYPLPRTLQIFIDNLKKNSFLLCACDPH